MNKIKVQAMESFKVYDSAKTNLLGEIFENKVYEAKPNKESGEYFVNDHQDRGVFVGEIDHNGDLKLDEDFKRVGCSICGDEGYILSHRYCNNPAKHHGVRKSLSFLE
ncbi:hypothetical protein [Paenibacillus pini]